MNVAPPSTQKAEERPISFVLDGGGASVSVDLVIRPEDLTRNDTSRLNVQQTLGGAWADNFGPGVPNISISGHTGWRRTGGSSEDGFDRFVQLKEQVFNDWHERRKVAVQSGQDPDTIQLVFADALNQAAVVVAPMSFSLRRSRSRPLLCQYQINMTVLDENIDQLAFLNFGGGFLDAGITEALGLDSLTASVNEITGMINGVQNFVDRTLVAPVRGFMNQTARLYGAVRGAIQSASNVAGSLISVARMTAIAGINVFRTLAAVASIPQQAKAWLMQVAGAYSNIWCVLRNALRQKLYVEDYSDMFGASNCSSTSGGRPISVMAGQNPFYSVVPTSGPLPVTVTSNAHSSLQRMAASDPVLSPMSTSDIRTNLQAVSDGLVVA